MEIGNRIKTYREHINLSQEELADKVYVSRQTISNWENDKSYPDINSLKLLSNIFDVSLDDLIKGDIEKMKKKINETDIRKMNKLSVIYTLELILVVGSAYPLLKFLGILGVIIWIVILLITMTTAYIIEKLKKLNIFTYKEIVSFMDNKTLSHDEKIEERAKLPYQKVFLSLISGLIALIIFILLGLFIG